jgi:hypothetical protein
MDVGLLSRCVALADITEAVVRALGPHRRCLDWAGGYGTLTRLMRDRGLDFHHHDPYTSNIFAAGHEGAPDEPWDVITLFEVLEHLPDPAAELQPLARSSPVLLFTTQLLPDPAPPPTDWWYYTLESGQHISFFTLTALAALGDRLGMRLASDGQNVHAFHRPGALPAIPRALVKRRRLTARLLGPLRRLRPSPTLLQDDFELARRNARSAT